MTLNSLATLATCATLIAMLWELRRNNSSVLRVVDASGRTCTSILENNGRTFHEFGVALQNLGVSLHGVVVKLEFDHVATKTRFSMPFRLRNGGADSFGEFSRGMRGEFSIKSYELHPHEVQLLGLLQDLAAQRAEIVVYAQGFACYRIWIGSIRQALRTSWNDCLGKALDAIQSGVSRVVGGDLGQHPERLLLRFHKPSISFQLTNFLRSVQAPRLAA